jgi:hypothetical protein
MAVRISAGATQAGSILSGLHHDFARALAETKRLEQPDYRLRIASSSKRGGKRRLAINFASGTTAGMISGRGQGA